MTKAGSLRPGGRTAQTRRAVLDATLAELVARGYDQLSVESVAQCAGVHKTTVYRRWGTKDQLVVEALEAVAERQIEVPNTGDVAGDLRALAHAVLVTLASRDGAAMVRTLVAGAQKSGDLEKIARRFWATRLAQGRPIIERAVARGQLPAGTSADDVIRYLAAPLYYQLLVTAEPLTGEAADLAARAALAAARAGAFVPV